MKPTADENRLTRWIDGDLSEEEAAQFLQEHPECVGERALAQAIGDRLRSAFSETPDISYPDFFNHQIRRRIEDDVFSPAADVDEPIRFSFFQRSRWIAAAGFVICVGALVGMVMRQAPGDRSEVVSTYTPTPNTTVTSSYDSTADATVIRIDGLPPIPADVVIGNTLDRLDGRKGRVIFSLQSREIGRTVSFLTDGNAANEFPGTMLVQF